MPDDFQYDVAFSFVAQDEGLATELGQLLAPRVRTFLYSKEQEQLAGTDGEATFSAVFGQQSRVVVILHRAAWGETPWTRIEATAIRNRAHDQGYDFALFIPLDKPPNLPKWVPKNRLWIGLDRWGAASAAAVIEARIQEQGGAPREETIDERAARHVRDADFKRERKAALASPEGVAEFWRSAAEFWRSAEAVRQAVEEAVQERGDGIGEAAEAMAQRDRGDSHGRASPSSIDGRRDGSLRISGLALREAGRAKMTLIGH